MNWISVKDRLPEEDVPVLVFWGHHIGEEIIEIMSRRAWVDREIGMECENHFHSEKGYLSDDVSHWMPLPEPPEETP